MKALERGMHMPTWQQRKTCKVALILTVHCNQFHCYWNSSNIIKSTPHIICVVSKCSGYYTRWCYWWVRTPVHKKALLCGNPSEVKEAPFCCRPLCKLTGQVDTVVNISHTGVLHISGNWQDKQGVVITQPMLHVINQNVNTLQEVEHGKLNVIVHTSITLVPRFLPNFFFHTVQERVTKACRREKPENRARALIRFQGQELWVWIRKSEQNCDGFFSR